MDQDWSVWIAQSGRGGSIIYREGGREARFDWEFAGGDAVALLLFLAWPDWLPPHRRREVMERVAQEAIRQKAPSCRYEIADDQCVVLR